MPIAYSTQSYPDKNIDLSLANQRPVGIPSPGLQPLKAYNMKAPASILMMLAAASQPGQPIKTVYKLIGDHTVYDVASKNVFIVTSGLMIDADGAPKAYHKDSSKALDYLGNAGATGDWWALVTDNKKSSGHPIVQTEDDPAPGFYVSMTALEDTTKAATDPHR